MSISDRMWERAAYLTRFDGTSSADMVASLVSAHFGQERMQRIASNVPDNNPPAITTHFLTTGLGAIVRADA